MRSSGGWAAERAFHPREAAEVKGQEPRLLLLLLVLRRVGPGAAEAPAEGVAHDPCGHARVEVARGEGPCGRGGAAGN